MHSLESTREIPNDEKKQVYRTGAFVRKEERPKSEEVEEDGVQQMPDGMGDAAALLVMLYLLFISTLLVGAIVIGFFVVMQYGLVVMVAVCTAVSGMLIVAATVTSVITRDKKLRKARSKIKSWHVTCKDEILKEIDNFKDDLAAYTSGTLMLTDGDDVSSQVEDSTVSSDGPNFEQATDDNVDKKQSSRKASMTASTKEHRPKSLLFRAIAPFTRSSRKGSAKQQSTKTKRSWKRKKSSKSVEASTYEPPDIV